MLEPENKEPVPYPTPTGPIKHAWFSHGYQAAMTDVIQKFNEGGEEALREWVRNNTRWQRRRNPR